MNQKAKVLIVDDEPNNVDFLEQALEDSGYQLITATNGQEALNKLSSENYDVVFTDIRMPGMRVRPPIKSGPRTVPMTIANDTVARPIVKLNREPYNKRLNSSRIFPSRPRMCCG